MDEAEKQLIADQKKQRRKKLKEQSRKHRARLVVHNLPFAATEDDVRKHFAKFGEVEEVKLLKKENGVLTGCGFVQFKLVQKAAKARHHLNGKPFLGREITCDFARPKDQYDGGKTSEEQIEYDPNIEIKDEPEDFDESTVKIEDVEVKDEQDVAIKEEDDEEESEQSEVDEEQSEVDEEPPEVDEEQSINEEESSDVEEVEPSVQEKKKVISNDASEGKTIFIKNCPFTAENEDVEECMSQFGPLHYALVCMDRLTEHSKGSAFVKFKNKTDADRCLEATDIQLMGHTLQCVRALTKQQLQDSHSKTDTIGKDSRNLYLVKEGVILAGSKAAEGVSASDMAKRLQLEQYKNQMLKNLNMFVSRNRLVIHNVPAAWNDAQLKALIKKHAPPKSIVKEARIMRNMRQLDAKGVGKSKEFGFVSFVKHEDALKVLRTLNNNPTIFSANKRPILTFSIENKSKLNAKQKQIENSKLKNPTFKHNILDKKNKTSKGNKKQNRKRTLEEVEGGVSEYTGVTAKPGAKKMRSKFNLKTQAQLHHERLKKEKKQKKAANKSNESKVREVVKHENRPSKRKSQDADNFSKLVGQYKKQLFSGNNLAKTKKWFEG